ncbi:MAG: lytic murein transglycosylase [Salaquimonas sp.]|nr:lytic murein transglycosylase [Salaquimonas sp.]
MATFLGAHQTHALDKPAVERQFQTWLKTDLWPRAKAAGVSAKTFNTAMSGVTLNWKLPGLVPPGEKLPKEQHQAEFRSPAGYFSEKIIGPVIAGGRARLEKYRSLLIRLEKQTGVPGRIVLAVWGRESGFGRASVPYNAFEVLATKAFMSTRKDMFEDELVAALVMVEKDHVPLALMKSSWAGALGQPQFMPSSWLAHAMDGDGDGLADIWKSDADTLASIANFLKHKGWLAGRDWGFEVTVPDSVSCALEGPDRGKKIANWVALGVKRVSGRPFPDRELRAEGYLLMPAGRSGPAFIVTPNFYVLKEYNTSDLYALFIGNAGDRIEYGGGPFVAKWGRVDALYRSDIAAMQRRLEKKGYDVGGVDGLPGFKTRRSIGEWQVSTGARPTCFPSAEILRTLKY